MTHLALNIEIEWLEGFCPVQAEGIVNGQPWYFRARGDHWSFVVYEDDKRTQLWNTVGKYGVQFEAGWMDLDRAETLIVKSCHQFAKNYGK